jgi:O-acetyl-ADP-ribose deacetylase (regulator of RNase III)
MGCVDSVFERFLFSSFEHMLFCAFSAGFPKQTAAQIILQSIRNYFNTTATSSLKQIFFVLYDTESVNIYTSELGRLDS